MGDDRKRSIELSRDEERLVRLFRLGDERTQQDTCARLFRAALDRFSCERFFQQEPDADFLKQEREMEFEERLRRCFPGGNEMGVWLDGLGDPHAHFENAINAEPILRFPGVDSGFVNDVFILLVNEAGFMHGSLYENSIDEAVQSRDEDESKDEAIARHDAAIEQVIRDWVEEWRDNLVDNLERRVELPPYSGQTDRSNDGL